MAMLDTPAGPVFFTDQGAGDGVILVHGFAASGQENWHRSGWVGMLARARRRVVTLDLRGHGESVRSHDPKHYSISAFADDVMALSSHLELKKPDLIGFSLGGRVVLELLMRAPDQFLLGVLCGAGGRWLEKRGEEQNALANAFETVSFESLPEGSARRFRQFADVQGQDREALAAVIRGLAHGSSALQADAVRSLSNEVIVVAGQFDDLAGDPAELAHLMRRGRSTVVPGCGHMDCLVQPMFKSVVMDLLAGQV